MKNSSWMQLTQETALYNRKWGNNKEQNMVTIGWGQFGAVVQAIDRDLPIDLAVFTVDLRTCAADQLRVGCRLFTRQRVGYRRRSCRLISGFASETSGFMSWTKHQDSVVWRRAPPGLSITIKANQSQSKPWEIKWMDSESETLECFYFETGSGSVVNTFVSYKDKHCVLQKNKNRKWTFTSVLIFICWNYATNVHLKMIKPLSVCVSK